MLNYSLNIEYKYYEIVIEIKVKLKKMSSLQYIRVDLLKMCIN